MEDDRVTASMTAGTAKKGGEEEGSGPASAGEAVEALSEAATSLQPALDEVLLALDDLKRRHPHWMTECNAICSLITTLGPLVQVIDKHALKHAKWLSEWHHVSNDSVWESRGKDPSSSHPPSPRQHQQRNQQNQQNQQHQHQQHDFRHLLRSTQHQPQRQTWPLKQQARQQQQQQQVSLPQPQGRQHQVQRTDDSHQRESGGNLSTAAAAAATTAAAASAAAEAAAAAATAAAMEIVVTVSRLKKLAGEARDIVKSARRRCEGYHGLFRQNCLSKRLQGTRARIQCFALAAVPLAELLVLQVSEEDVRTSREGLVKQLETCKAMLSAAGQEGESETAISPASYFTASGMDNEPSDCQEMKEAARRIQRLICFKDDVPESEWSILSSKNSGIPSRPNRIHKYSSADSGYIA
ncbi:hypothetical protein CBR_g2751 [Chara braunii]|uniref:Uncharacterized protein n=1 Tax=Chara braunii TaxID=69332 RepID=A0A388KDS4_CHABU|nr:hypothetical protein CBR_g2751 [Chara braunii]|eukprot:GBG68199.1 hypothetical protein CBR_g2751 [Chara braunii]